MIFIYLRISVFLIYTVCPSVHPSVGFAINANSSYILMEDVWNIFGTIIANGVNMTANVSDCRYGLGVKGQS